MARPQPEVGWSDADGAAVRTPSRLNLAIAKRCFVACRGCYAFFGRGEPALQAMVDSVAQFVRLGVRDVTLSGGDPLTIDGLDDFLSALRRVGVREIKLDTVGATLTEGGDGSAPIAPRAERIAALLDAVDALALPLDGVDNDTVALFRRGRARLFDETVAILTEIARQGRGDQVLINTVAHAGNLDAVPAIGDALSATGLDPVWNAFQYCPTDQAAAGANDAFRVADQAFDALRTATMARAYGRPTDTRFWSNRDRLGSYFLVNSDGDAWAPDRHGATIALGSIFGREAAALAAWRSAFEGAPEVLRARVPGEADA